MTIKHRLFAHHYLLTADKYEAYKRVYPKASGEALKAAARRLANRPEILHFMRAEHSRFTEQALSQAYVDMAKDGMI